VISLSDFDRPPAVEVEGLRIAFKTTSETYPTLKHTLMQVFERSKSRRRINALDGVSFTVPQGSVYGVIGRNGAGKSTLFRAVAGILTPTSGRITVRGRVTPLISLGVGFNRELTGRENILLGGLAAGLHPEQIIDQYQNIVTFAELGEAIDSPMRTYSSGMFARLGFAIAVHLDPEILLIDEALSAGDAKFKDRCTEKILELAMSDCTFMLVTHGLELVRAMADYCLWIEKGRVRGEGPADEIVAAYLENEGMQAELAAMIDV
jgi:ABC-type polysaccharide/polyol phosphate transport system ATPase subunit